MSSDIPQLLGALHEALVKLETHMTNGDTAGKALVDEAKQHLASLIEAIEAEGDPFGPSSEA